MTSQIVKRREYVLNQYETKLFRRSILDRSLGLSVFSKFTPSNKKIRELEQGS